MILGIDWPYGIWKTAFAVWYAKEFKKKYWNDWIVVSNIKLYWNPFEDYIHFDYANLTNVLRLINYINDSERKDIKNRYKLSNWKLEYKRGAFTKFLILFDAKLIHHWKLPLNLPPETLLVLNTGFLFDRLMHVEVRDRP